MELNKEKIQLDAQEHYILANLKGRVPLYLLMWLAAVVLALVASHLPIQQPVADYSDVQVLSRAFLTIAVVTVTFAIPTCMRTIFAAYEQYYSTKIREVLLARFPVVLLALSAFTSLIVSLLAISGLAGLLPLPAAFSFYICLFWTFVCVGYLFVAIEKLIYFVVRAPFAVLDKLEYHIDAADASESREQYAEFRREISSMNDIAATILAKSTGRDEAVTKTLAFFRSTHARYVDRREGEDGQGRKRRLNACRATDHEIVRIFREACGARNEQACRKVMKTYCSMLADAAAADVSDGYFSDMLVQLERMLSYASFSKVEEVEYLASVGWFFLLAGEAGDSAFPSEKRAAVARRLSASLRDETVSGATSIIAKFLRTAANSDLEYDIESFSPTWQVLLDRGIVVYMTWLLDTMPDGAEQYLADIRRYSTVNTDAYRNVLPDSMSRLRGLFLAESMDSPAGVAHSSDETVMMMGMNWEDTAARTLAMMCALNCANIKVSSLPEMGHAGAKLFSDIGRLCARLDDAGRRDEAENDGAEDVDSLFSTGIDEQMTERVRLAGEIDDNLDKQLDAARELGRAAKQAVEN